MTMASGHLECASVTTRIIFPMKGPKKSTWTRSQGCDGQDHTWRSASAGAFQCCWQASQPFTVFSICLSMPGHQRMSRAACFILTTPGCPSWSSSRTLSQSLVGMTTLLPQSRHFPSAVISSFRCRYGFNSSGTVCGQPWCL